MQRIFKSLIAISILTALVSCDYDKNHPGYSYFPDMADSRAYESYTINYNFADSINARMPVIGTIPRGIIPYTLTKSEEDRAVAAKTIFNNSVTSKNDIIKGGESYKIFCINCHGAQW